MLFVNTSLCGFCMSIKKIILILIYFFCYRNIIAQELTDDFFDYRRNKIIYESNMNAWSQITSFGPLRYQDFVF